MKKTLLSWIAAAACVVCVGRLVKYEARTMRAEAARAIDEAGERTVGRIVREAGSVVAREAPTPSPGSRPELPRRVGEWVDVAHRTTEAIDRVGDGIAGLGDEEERALGRQLRQSLGKSLKIDRDPAVNARVRRLLEPLRALRRRDILDLDVAIVTSREINAFSHAGGYIYIHRGLIDLGLTDAELQFVLGHELGHVELRHCAKAIGYAHRAEQVLGPTAGMLVG